MTKHRRTRTRRRSQRGGEGEYQVPNNDQSWYSGIAGLFSTGVQKVKDAANSVNTTIGNVATSGANAFSDTTSSVVDVVSAPFSSSSDTTIQSGMNGDPSQSGMNGDPSQSGMNGNPNQSGMTVNSYGQQAGRRRKRCRSMKGGKGGSNLAYYAAPVSGLKVAEPTTWQYYANGVNQYSVKGGSRKRRSRKSRRTRRHKKH